MHTHVRDGPQNCLLRLPTGTTGTGTGTGTGAGAGTGTEYHSRWDAFDTYEGVRRHLDSLRPGGGVEEWLT